MVLFERKNSTIYSVLHQEIRGLLKGFPIQQYQMTPELLHCRDGSPNGGIYFILSSAWAPR
jgi:hypothetical protein